MVEHNHKFMLYTGKYSELQAMRLHNRQQEKLFGLFGGDFVCCRCRNHGDIDDGFFGVFSLSGTFLCSDCLDEINEWKASKRR